jgi:hypothetical protein
VVEASAALVFKAEIMKCECQDPATIHGAGNCSGPAAFEVTRKGQQVRLCSRCILIEDKPSAKLIAPESEYEALREYDPQFDFFRKEIQK